MIKELEINDSICRLVLLFVVEMKIFFIFCWLFFRFDLFKVRIMDVCGVIGYYCNCG